VNETPRSHRSKIVQGIKPRLGASTTHQVTSTAGQVMFQLDRCYHTLIRWRFEVYHILTHTRISTSIKKLQSLSIRGWASNKLQFALASWHQPCGPVDIQMSHLFSISLHLHTTGFSRFYA